MKTDRPSAAWRRILLPLGALLLSGVLLFTGLSALAAQAADRAAPQESGRSAPLQQVTVPYQFAISKTAFPDRFTVGSSNSYIIRVTNPITVPGYAHIVTIQDDLPSGMTWTPPTSGLWNCQNSTTTQVNCIYSVLGAYSFDPLFVNVTVASDITAPDINAIPNTARLTVDPPEADPTNPTYPNQSTDTVEINSADLELSKTVFPATADVGDIITYTLAITNNGPNTVNSFVVQDLNLPSSGLTFVGQLPNDLSYNDDTGLWSFTSPTPILVDGEVRKQLVFLVGTEVAGQINNTARINSAFVPGGIARSDWNVANNVDTASIVVGGLEIFKTITVPNGSTDPITATVGEPILVTINVTNPTTIDVTNGFTVTEQIPEGLDLRFPLPTGSRWDPTTRIYTFRRATTLAAGQSFAFSITLIGSSSINFQQEFTNVATVTWGSPPNSVDSNEVNFTVFPGGALHVTKTDNLTQVYAGDTISYTIAVTNTGNVQVNQVVLTDTLGSQLAATGLNLGSVAVGSCPNVSYCRITLNNPLGPGQKVTFRLGARVSPNAVPGTSVVNRVDASGLDNETNAQVFSTYTDSNLVLQSPSTSLRILKEVTPVQAKVGETFTFVIDVRNTGSVAVSNVRITDEFEPVLDLVSATTTRGVATLNTGARTVDVIVSTLDAGQRVTVVVTARVNSTVTVDRIYRNFADVIWSPGGQSLRSPSVPFRVLPSSALPGTGLVFAWPGRPVLGTLGMNTNIPRGGEQAQPPAGALVSGGLGLLAVGLGLLAILLLGYSLWARANRPLYAGKAARSGLAMVLLALIFGLGAVLLRPIDAPTAQLASLAGNKPPLATHAPTKIPAPTATPRLPGPAQEQPAETVAPENQPAEVHSAPTIEPLPTEIAHLIPTPTPSVLPDYPIPTPTAMPAVGPDGGPPDPSAVTRILIPAINLDTMVKYVPFNGSTWLISGLKQEVAWMGDTSWPGLGGNTGLAGHVDLVDGSAGPFWDLKQLQPGDQVIVYTQSKVYTYRVREQRVVPDTDLSVIAATSNPQITLITCTNWSSELRTYLQRLVVFAELVQVQAQAQ
jgi:LPXTG-site transpeptidase (sortase) family protein